MKWRQKYHVTSAVHNIPSFASISQWACRSSSQPGRNRPEACSIGPVRHGRSTGFVHWYACITRLFQYISIKSYKKKYSNEDEAVTAHLPRQPATNPPGHTLEPPKNVYLGESKVRPSHCRELSCNPGSHDSNLKRPERLPAGHR